MKNINFETGFLSPEEVKIRRIVDAWLKTPPKDNVKEYIDRFNFITNKK